MTAAIPSMWLGVFAPKPRTFKSNRLYRYPGCTQTQPALATKLAQAHSSSELIETVAQPIAKQWPAYRLFYRGNSLGNASTSQPDGGRYKTNHANKSDIRISLSNHISRQLVRVPCSLCRL